jgi:hypothetical protein
LLYGHEKIDGDFSKALMIRFQAQAIGEFQLSIIWKGNGYVLKGKDEKI